MLALLSGSWRGGSRARRLGFLLQETRNTATFHHENSSDDLESATSRWYSLRCTSRSPRSTRSSRSRDTVCPAPCRSIDPGSEKRCGSRGSDLLHVVRLPSAGGRSRRCAAPGRRRLRRLSRAPHDQRPGADAHERHRDRAARQALFARRRTLTAFGAVPRSTRLACVASGFWVPGPTTCSSWSGSLAWDLIRPTSRRPGRWPPGALRDTRRGSEPRGRRRERSVTDPADGERPLGR